MSEKPPDLSSHPNRERNGPTRDSRGRWASEPPAAATTDPQDFVFDDRIFEEAAAPLEGERRLSPEDLGSLIENIFAPAAAAPAADAAAAAKAPDEPAAGPEPGSPWSAPISSRLVFSRKSGLLGGALLLLAILVFLFRRDYFGAKPAELETPAPTIVAPVVVPAAPKQPLRRSAARATTPAAKKGREPARTRAAVVSPARPRPAAAAAGPIPASPQPPPVSGRASAPALAAPAPATPAEEGWFKLGEEYVQMGDDKRAEALYRRILNEGTQRGRAALALGDLFAGRADYQHAQEYYRLSRRLFQDGNQPISPP